MAKHILDSATVFGHMSLMPHTADRLSIAAWQNQHETSMYYLGSSGSTIEVEAPIKNTELTCAISETSLYFFVMDHEPENSPTVFECRIEKDRLPADVLSLYMDCKEQERNGAAWNARQSEILDTTRNEVHTRLAMDIIEKLKTAGLSFEHEDRAETGIHGLTALWFDLLDRRGKLDPRTNAQKGAEKRRPGLG